MNSSTYISIHTETNLWSYTSIGDYYDATQSHPPCTDYASSLYDNHSSWTGGSSGESLALGPWSDADQALFEAFLTADVASTGPSGPCTIVHMQSSPPYDDPQPGWFHGPPEAGQLHPLGRSQRYPFTTVPPQSNVSLPFEQPAAVYVSQDLSQDLICPLLPSDYVPDGGCSIAAASKSSHASHHLQSLCPCPSPSPEPSPQTSSTVVAWQRRNVPATAGQSLHSQASEQPLSWTAMSCVAPDLIYPHVACEHDLGDHHPPDASSKSSRATPSSPYPSPSPELSPRTSSIVMVSQRRNAPARTAAPVPTQTWQCPHCPYVQRNRRSPDLKRHIKTHTRDTEVADWVCCGVPVMNAIELGVPATTLREAEVFEFDGVLMVGGCRKAFSRRDALIRHLQREKGRCFGDAQSLHQRGNKESC